MTDRLGNEIKPGCYIAYGHALGRCAGLRLGRVEAVNVSFEAQYDTSTVTVLGIDDDWEGHMEPHMLGRKSTLYFPNRMVVIPNIPEKLARLYENDCVALGKKHKWADPKSDEKLCAVCGNGKGKWIY